MENNSADNTSAASPKSSSKKKTFWIIGCIALFFFVVVCGGGGFVGYQYWYVPQQKQEYVDTHKPPFEDVAKQIEEIGDGVKAENFGILAADDINKFEKDTKAAIEDLETVKKTAEGNKAVLPSTQASSSGIKDANTLLHTYYDGAIATSEEYKQVLEDTNELIPVLNELGDILTSIVIPDIEPGDFGGFKEAQDQMAKLETDLQNFRKDLEAVDVGEDVSEMQTILLDFIDATIEFVVESKKTFSDLSKLGSLAEGDLESALEPLATEFDKTYDSFLKAVDKAEKDEAEYAEKMKKKFTDKFNELDKKSDDARALLDALTSS